MHNSLYGLYFAYQPTKNMKYLGPKGSVPVKIKKETKPLIQHSMDLLEQNIGVSHHKIIIGFESDKILKSISNTSIDYSIILDYKNCNHGKIIKDTLLKYDYKKFNGIFIVSDISTLLTSEPLIDTNKNYIFYSKTNNIPTDLTCNIINNNIEHISYNTSDAYWTGMCFLSNKAISLLKHVNQIYFTDPLFLFEILNYLISKGLVCESYEVKNNKYAYVDNNTLKLAK